MLIVVDIIYFAIMFKKYIQSIKNLVKYFLGLLKNFFSGMTLPKFFYAVITIVIAWQANTLINNQNNLIKLQYSPRFDADMEMFYDSIDNSVLRKEIQIYNNGGYYYEKPEIKYVSFLELEIHNNTNIRNFSIPVKYYFVTIGHGNKIGLIKTIRGGEKNVDDYVKFVKEVEGYCRSRHDSYCSLNLLTYISIAYKDLITDKDVIFYQKINFGDEFGRLIDSKNGSKIFADYKISEMIDLSSENGDALGEVEKIIDKNSVGVGP